MPVEHFKPAAIIPVYNHGSTVRATVQAVLEHVRPVYVVDDGSNPETAEAIQQTSREFNDVVVIRFSENRGKGAAVMAGLLRAKNDGMTHALQIDADGQHDTRDIPRFLDCAAAHPYAVVSGVPIFDASAPASRRYGRLVSHFWVWIETLSMDIKDSMCGFRSYPLAATCELIHRNDLPERMDFDTAIIVRLSWQDVRVLNIPTRVIYPVNGLSHFNMLKDNWQISMMHTRLVFGMLLRLPLLLKRKLFPGKP